MNKLGMCFRQPNRVNRLLPRAAAVLLALALLWTPTLTGAVQAQTSPVSTAANWAPVAPIPQFYPEALPPVMVTDENHTVHAFASLPLSDDPADPLSQEMGIFYRQWTLEGGWTPLNDILLTPVKLQARVKDAYLDNAGIIHLIFYGGDEQEAYTYYTSAPAAAANSAQAWAAPMVIGPQPITPEVAAITGDGEEKLVALYSGNLGEGNSLYVVYSDDAGATWTDPAMLFSTYTVDDKVFDFDWHLGESGRLYAVWNVTDKNGQNVGGYFAKMEKIADKKWTKPVELAESVGLGIAIPAITEYNGNVMLIYNNGEGEEVAPVMWFKMSTDGGERFTGPLKAFPDHIGRNGVISFVEDSADTLHVFFGQRLPGGYGDNLDLHGMWHSTWDGSSWRPLTPVVSGPISGTFDPYDARAAIVQGNVILLTWRTDPGRDISSTWYSHTVLNTPELPAVPLPPVQAQYPAGAPQSLSGGAAGLADLLATPTPQPIVTAPLEFSRQPSTSENASPAVPLVGALVPTVLFVAAALLFGSLRRPKT
jgi:hypothetical protein